MSSTAGLNCHDCKTNMRFTFLEYIYGSKKVFLFPLGVSTPPVVNHCSRPMPLKELSGVLDIAVCVLNFHNVFGDQFYETDFHPPMSLVFTPIC